MELEKHPVKPLRLLADDATPEALTSLLAENQGCMGIISAEGGLFDMAAGQYSDHVNIDVLLKAYSGDPMMVDRKGRPAEQIEHPCLTMLLTVQPSVLRTVMQNAVFRGRGFLARILYTLPPSLVGRRRFETQPVPSLAEKGYAMQLTSLLSIPRPDSPGEISLSREAYESARGLCRSPGSPASPGPGRAPGLGGEIPRPGHPDCRGPPLLPVRRGRRQIPHGFENHGGCRENRRIFPGPRPGSLSDYGPAGQPLPSRTPSISSGVWRRSRG